MIKTVSATYARIHFYEILDRVYATNEPVIVTQRGKAVAAIISHADYQEMISHPLGRDAKQPTRSK